LEQLPQAVKRFLNLFAQPANCLTLDLANLPLDVIYCDQHLDLQVITTLSVNIGDRIDLAYLFKELTPHVVVFFIGREEDFAFTFLFSLISF